LLKWRERRVELLVEKLFPQIQKLALALLDHGKLSGDQIQKVLHDYDST
jgi:hypothetical protein